MTVYQVMDEDDQCMATFYHYQEAVYAAQDFTKWDEAQNYYIEELDLQVV